MTTLDNSVVLEPVKNGLIFGCHQSRIEISFDNAKELKVLLKAIFTQDVEEKLGKCVQIPKKIICLFRRKGVELVQKDTRILIHYDQFQKVCQFIADQTLEWRIKDKYELQLFQNFLKITLCLGENERKEVLLVLRNKDEKNMNRLYSTLLSSSKLDPKNEYFHFVLRNLFADNIHYLDLVLYAKKVAEVKTT